MYTKANRHVTSQPAWPKAGYVGSIGDLQPVRVFKRGPGIHDGWYIGRAVTNDGRSFPVVARMDQFRDWPIWSRV